MTAGTGDTALTWLGVYIGIVAVIVLVLVAWTVAGDWRWNRRQQRKGGQR